MIKEYQGYLISTFLSGMNVDKIEKVDTEGFDNYLAAVFSEIKKVYTEVGEVDLSKLNLDMGRMIELMDQYMHLSLSVDYCIKQLEKDAHEKRIYRITEKLRKGELPISEAITELDKLHKEEKGSLVDMSEIEYQSLEDKQHDGIETGFYEYDRLVNDWKPGEITLLFGRNGEGKTTYISQVLAHSISVGTKSFLYSGELSNNKIQEWLYRQIVGAEKDCYRTFQTKYGIKHELKKNVVEAIKEWHKGKLYIYNKDARKNTKSAIDNLFITMKQAVKNDVKLFVIDNLMAILEENADSLYSDQANFTQRCKDFAVDNNVHVVLMAHPNKEKKEITGEVGNLEKTDNSGSNNIPNKCDNVITVERVWNEEIEIDAIVTTHKDREVGARKVFKYMFSKETLRFYNDVTSQTVRYGWRKFLKPEKKEVKYYNGAKQTFEEGEMDDLAF